MLMRVGVRFQASPAIRTNRCLAGIIGSEPFPTLVGIYTGMNLWVALLGNTNAPTSMTEAWRGTIEIGEARGSRPLAYADLRFKLAAAATILTFITGTTSGFTSGAAHAVQVRFKANEVEALTSATFRRVVAVFRGAGKQALLP